MSDFILDIKVIRESARKKIEDGAVTADYRASKKKVIELLQSALATEWICVLRYTQHQLAAEGIHAEPVARHFSEHAEQERGHALQIGSRIKQLGGHPTLDPKSMVKASHTEYQESASLLGMIKENLIAERIAVSTYSEIIRYLGNDDPTTRRMLEGILATEEEHAEDMASLLVSVGEKERLN